MKKGIFYGEYAICTEEEKEEAKTYLTSWKKFLLKRLKRKCSAIEVMDEQWTEIGPEYSGMTATEGTISIKLYITHEDNYELSLTGAE